MRNDGEKGEGVNLLTSLFSGLNPLPLRSDFQSIESSVIACIQFAWTGGGGEVGQGVEQQHCPRQERGEFRIRAIEGARRGVRRCGQRRDGRREV